MKKIDFHRCIRFRMKILKRMADLQVETKIWIEKKIKEMDIKIKDP
jgi:hypothetical protein